MKTDFVSLVSHQLKTPVAGVLGCIENILAGLAGPVTPQQEEYLLMMKDISLRNFRNINDLLNVSRIERGVIEAKILSVNLKVIAAGVVREHLPALREKGLSAQAGGMEGPLRYPGGPGQTVRVAQQRVSQRREIHREGLDRDAPEKAGRIRPGRDRGHGAGNPRQPARATFSPRT